MPNDCVNHVTVYADTATINLLKAAGPRIPDRIRAKKLPETLQVYDYKFHQAGQGAIRFSITSAWRPALDLLDGLIAEYPTITFIKNEWYIEDGGAGVWVADRKEGQEPVICQVSWDEGCMEEIHHRFSEPKA